LPVSNNYAGSVRKRPGATFNKCFLRH
jgi:hypothetical protein